MNQKLTILTLVLALAITSNCKKEEKNDDDTVLLLLLLSQKAGGDCAQTTRTSSTEFDVSFSAGTAGCSSFTTRQQAVDAIKAIYTSAVATLAKAGTACDSVRTTTAATGTALTADNNAFTGRFSTTGASSTDATYAAVQQATYRVATVGSMITEAAATITAGGGNPLTAKAATTAQVEINTTNFFTTAGSACRAAVDALDSTLATGVTNKTIYTSTSCKFGTAPAVTATNRCATLNTTF